MKNLNSSGNFLGWILRVSIFTVIILFAGCKKTDPIPQVTKTVPGAPTIGVATALDAAVSVTFTAPVSDGGTPITGYTATATASDNNAVSVSGMTSPLTITSLTNGVKYTVVVKASNAIGTSVASAPSTEVIPASKPSAPTAVVATALDASASVAFTAPSFDGGMPITSYAVTSSNGITATGTTSPIIVPGLLNNVKYTFTVQAKNSIGASASSSASNEVIPLDVRIAYMMSPRKCTPTDMREFRYGAWTGDYLDDSEKDDVYSFDENGKGVWVKVPGTAGNSFNWSVTTDKDGKLAVNLSGQIWTVDSAANGVLIIHTYLNSDIPIVRRTYSVR